ncbi:MAG: aldehyde dehydrogenase family protein [Gammaproteobacteria bacterium]
MMLETRNYIGGDWRAGASEIPDENPSDTRDIIGNFAQAGAAEVEEAIDAAAQAQAKWAQSGPELRYNALMTIGAALDERAAELGELLAREEGKTVPEGVGEVRRAGQFFTYFAAQALRQMGEVCDSVRAGVEVQVTREPVGVVGVITPWNFPVALPAWKIAPALAYGNAVVWKPANLTPACSAALMQIIADAMRRHDMPPGLVNLTLGAGATAGEALVASKRVDAITFTGSLATGRRIAAAAAANLTKLQMEMGSKNPLVVADDANMETAVACAVNGSFFSAGQKCTASSRLVVTRAIHDAFIEAMQRAMSKLVVGHALQRETQIGPAVDARQLQQNLHYLEVAKKDGAELVCGGERLDLATPGHYMRPALLAGGDNAMRINREEVFGPLTCVIAADDYEHALALANETEFGLTAGIITQSLARAAHFRRHAQSGCVMVNLPTSGTDYHVPFGGRKNSSFGSREQGQYAAEFYTQVKTAYIAA